MRTTTTSCKKTILKVLHRCILLIAMLSKFQSLTFTILGTQLVSFNPPWRVMVVYLWERSIFSIGLSTFGCIIDRCCQCCITPSSWCDAHYYVIAYWDHRTMLCTCLLNWLLTLDLHKLVVLDVACSPINVFSVRNQIKSERRPTTIGMVCWLPGVTYSVGARRDQRHGMNS